MKITKINSIELNLEEFRILQIAVLGLQNDEPVFIRFAKKEGEIVTWTVIDNGKQIATIETEGDNE